MEQYIPYWLICDLFSRNLETYLHVDIVYVSNRFIKTWQGLNFIWSTLDILFSLCDIARDYIIICNRDDFSNALKFQHIKLIVIS